MHLGLDTSSTSNPSDTSTDELLRQVLINTSSAFPALLQGMRSMNIAISTGSPRTAADSSNKPSVHEELLGPLQQKPPMKIAAYLATPENFQPPVSSKLLVVEEEYSAAEEWISSDPKNRQRVQGIREPEE